MPYRNAWLWVLLLFVLTFVAFWPGYFSKLPAAKVAHHYHTASSILWMILAISQSWTAHNGQLTLHRKIGPAVFLLFPFFLVAGIWVIHVEAGTVASDLNSSEGKRLTQFGFFDPLANIAFAVLFWAGLRCRYKVQLHARYMLATLLFVVGPISWRLFGRVSTFLKNDENFSYSMILGNLIALAVTLFLYRQAPKHGLPFVIAAGFIVVQQVTFETLGRIPAWGPVFASLSDMSLPYLLALTGVAGAGIAWHGWVAGARPQAPEVAVAA